MKSLMFWEYKPEDLDKVLAKWANLIADREKNPEKYPKEVFPPHGMSGEHKGITIVDNATEEQRNNTIIHYHPEMQLKFVPLHDAAKFVEQYMKKK